MPWSPAKTLWSRMHVDFAGLINDIVYLVLVDLHSKWPGVISIPSTLTATIISASSWHTASHKFRHQTVENDFVCRNTMNTANKKRLIASIRPHISQDQMAKQNDLSTRSNGPC
ncbi:unnamed protein product [Hymenolepis diminuta]|uniref:Integrase catalytic domain-containing protein n=1 Tax=Hymenolepis diminuta TaxID=6216 RepID=A0A0R3SJ44_HYMDI|nr:unnamed protein product [Hymenolepis diminuta]